jgi:hypothetical protein
MIRGHASFTVEMNAPLKPPAKWARNAARLSRMDRLCGLALLACDAALIDAGIPELDSARTALVFGSAFGCHATNQDYYQSFLRGEPSPRLFAYTLPSSPVGELSIHYKIRGPATTVTSGLTSGLDAVAEGLRLLRRGRVDRALIVCADVATPLLQQLLDAPLVDAAAAIILDGADDSVVEQTFGAAAPARPPSTLSVAPLFERPSGVTSASDPAGNRTVWKCRG